MLFLLYLHILILLNQKSLLYFTLNVKNKFYLNELLCIYLYATDFV